MANHWDDESESTKSFEDQLHQNLPAQLSFRLFWSATVRDVFEAKVHSGNASICFIGEYYTCRDVSTLTSMISEQFNLYGKAKILCRDTMTTCLGWKINRFNSRVYYHLKSFSSVFSKDKFIWYFPVPVLYFWCAKQKKSFCSQKYKFGSRMKEEYTWHGGGA
jgi:hypothetical protein